MCVLKLFLENLKILIDVVLSKFELNFLFKCLDKVCYIFFIYCLNQFLLYYLLFVLFLFQDFDLCNVCYEIEKYVYKMEKFGFDLDDGIFISDK